MSDTEQPLVESQRNEAVRNTTHIQLVLLIHGYIEQSSKPSIFVQVADVAYPDLACFPVHVPRRLWAPHRASMPIVFKGDCKDFWSCDHRYGLRRARGFVFGNEDNMAITDSTGGSGAENTSVAAGGRCEY